MSGIEDLVNYVLEHELVEGDYDSHFTTYVKTTYVLLGCERGGTYKKYKNDLEVTVTGNRKWNYLFKLQGKLVGKG